MMVLLFLALGDRGGHGTQQADRPVMIVPINPAKSAFVYGCVGLERLLNLSTLFSTLNSSHLWISRQDLCRAKAAFFGSTPITGDKPILVRILEPDDRPSALMDDLE
jgi:hypothetical protein